MPNTAQLEKIVRTHEIRHYTGFSKTRIIELVKSGQFPKPIKLSPGTNGALGWRESTIAGWLAERERATQDAAA